MDLKSKADVTAAPGAAAETPLPAGNWPLARQHIQADISWVFDRLEPLGG